MKTYVRIGIVGFGNMGRQHVSAFARLREGCGFEVEFKIFDPVLDDPIAFKGKALQRVKTIQALIETVDGVIIAAPADQHFNLVKTIPSDIPILLEKPLDVLTLRNDWDQFLNRRIFMAYPRRYLNLYQVAKDKIGCGEIGDVFQYCAYFQQPFEELRPDWRSSYYPDVNRGGGAVNDALPHHLDIVHYIFGMPKNMQLAAISSCLVAHGVPDTVSVVVEHEKVVGTISVNQYQKINVDRLEVSGTQGTLVVDRINGRLILERYSSREIEDFSETWQHALENQVMAFSLGLASGDFSQMRSVDLAEEIGKFRLLQDRWCCVQNRSCG